MRGVFLFVFPKFPWSTLDYHTAFITAIVCVSKVRSASYQESYLWDDNLASKDHYQPLMWSRHIQAG
jgi:hypothetical protein